MTRIVWLALLAACGSGDDYLDSDVVTSLPNGDAVGAAASGNYALESLTTRCAGSCAGSFSGVRFSACDVGARLTNDSIITQTDGHLVVDIDGSRFVSRLEGGINADGTFDVGGLRTQLGGALSIIARAEGSITSDGFDGTTQLRAVGEDLDCAITVEITAARIP